MREREMRDKMREVPEQAKSDVGAKRFEHLHGACTIA